ncbi:MAG: hypothetical protein DRP68_06390, partial [Candidatus Omnitrophota bacterium]
DFTENKKKSNTIEKVTFLKEADFVVYRLTLKAEYSDDVTRGYHLLTLIRGSIQIRAPNGKVLGKYTTLEGIIIPTILIPDYLEKYIIYPEQETQLIKSSIKLDGGKKDLSKNNLSDKILKKQIKKVLLIRAYPLDRPVNERRKEVRLPLGLIYLYSALKQRFKDELEVELLDLAVESEKLDLYKFIKEGKFDLIGISTITSIYYEVANDIAKTAREASPDSIVITGGVHASIAPRDVVKTKLYDAVFIQDGEKSLCSFIEEVSYGEGNLAKVRGIWYISEDNKVHFTGEPEYPNLNEIDLSIGFKKVDFSKYILEFPYFGGEKTVHLITSRGCPYSCKFCTIKKVWSRKYRYMEAPKIVEIMKFLRKEYGINNFNLDDDIFTFDRERVIKLCQLILQDEALQNIRWKITTRADRLDEELLKMMYKAGLRYIAIGLETVDPSVLKAVDKRLDLKSVEDVVKVAHELGIKVRYFLMIGLPYQTKESIERTIEFIRKTQPDEAHIATFVPYPGTEMGDNPEKFGIRILNRDLTQYYMRDWRKFTDFGEEEEKEPLIETRWMSREEIKEMRKKLMEALKDGGQLLEGLTDPITKKYILKMLILGYEKLGIDREIVEKFVEILSSNYDKPSEVVKRKVLTDSELKSVFSYPYGKFHRAYREYRRTGRYAWFKSLVDMETLIGVMCDVGCGNNALGEYLLMEAKEIKKVIGVDLVKYPDVREAPPNLEFRRVTNPLKLPLESESIDIVSFVYTLHHVPYENQVTVLKEAYRGLKEKGIGIIIEDTYATTMVAEMDYQNLIKELLELSDTQIYSVLSFSDWLTNSSIVYPNIPQEVPIPAVFRSMEEWTKIFERVGFYIEEERFVGLPQERIHLVPMGFFLLRKDGGRIFYRYVVVSRILLDIVFIGKENRLNNARRTLSFEDRARYPARCTKWEGEMNKAVECLRAKTRSIATPKDLTDVENKNKGNTIEKVAFLKEVGLAVHKLALKAEYLNDATYGCYLLTLIRGSVQIRAPNREVVGKYTALKEEFIPIILIFASLRKYIIFPQEEIEIIKSFMDLDGGRRNCFPFYDQNIINTIISVNVEVDRKTYLKNLCKGSSIVNRLWRKLTKFFDEESAYVIALLIPAFLGDKFLKIDLGGGSIELSKIYKHFSKADDVTEFYIFDLIMKDRERMKILIPEPIEIPRAFRQPLFREFLRPVYRNDKVVVFGKYSIHEFIPGVHFDPFNEKIYQEIERNKQSLITYIKEMGYLARGRAWLLPEKIDFDDQIISPQTGEVILIDVEDFNILERLEKLPFNMSSYLPTYIRSVMNTDIENLRLLSSWNMQERRREIVSIFKKGFREADRRLKENLERSTNILKQLVEDKTICRKIILKYKIWVNCNYDMLFKKILEAMPSKNINQSNFDGGEYNNQLNNSILSFLNQLSSNPHLSLNDIINRYLVIKDLQFFKLLLESLLEIQEGRAPPLELPEETIQTLYNCLF